MEAFILCCAVFSAGIALILASAFAKGESTPEVVGWETWREGED